MYEPQSLYVRILCIICTSVLIQNKGWRKIMVMDDTDIIFKKLTLLLEPLEYPIRPKYKIRINQHRHLQPVNQWLHLRVLNQPKQTVKNENEKNVYMHNGYTTIIVWFLNAIFTHTPKHTRVGLNNYSSLILSQLNILIVIYTVLKNY